MSDNKSSKRAAVDRLAQALIDDILYVTDAEIIAEAKEGGGDPSATAARLRSVYKQALAGANNSRLAAAKAAVAADQRGVRSGTVRPLDTSVARARLEAALRQDPETRNKLTLAARKGEGLSDADVQSMLEDLEELGILPPEDDEGGGT